MINGIGETAQYSSTAQTESNELHIEDCKRQDIYGFSYNPQNDGYYPYRLDGMPVHLSAIGVGQSCFVFPTEENGITLDFHSAEKFFSPDLSSAERQLLYENTLDVKEFQENDRRYVYSGERQESEIHLVGKLSVFAKVAINAGTCIGVYAGEVINDNNFNKFSKSDLDSHALIFDICSGFVKSEEVIVGDGAISRIKGIFERSENSGWHEGSSGYNVCMAGVPGKMNNGDELLIPCCFAISDITPGTELRLHYGYSNQMVENAMNKYHLTI